MAVVRVALVGPVEPTNLLELVVVVFVMVVVVVVEAVQGLPVLVTPAVEENTDDDRDEQDRHRDDRQQPPLLPLIPLVAAGALPVVRGRGLRHVGRGARHFEPGQLRCEAHRFGAELVGRLVVRDRATAELLGDHVAVLGLVGSRCTEFAGCAAELRPCGIHGPAHDDRAEVGSPEDDRLVLCGETHDAARVQPAVAFTARRQAEIALGSAHALVLGQDLAGDDVGAGGRAVEDGAAGVLLPDAVRGNVELFAVLGPQWAHRSARCAASHVDRRGDVTGNGQAGELIGQLRRRRRERTRLAVPGHLPAGEVLRHHVAAEHLVVLGHAEHASGAAQLVPGGVDGTANHAGAGVRRPEDDGIVGGAERGVAAVGRPAVTLVDVGEPEVTVGGSAQGEVLVQDRAAHDAGPGVRGEVDLAACEVLAEPRTDGIYAAILDAQWARGSAAGIPGLRYGDVGIRGGVGPCHGCGGPEKAG